MILDLDNQYIIIQNLKTLNDNNNNIDLFRNLNEIKNKSISHKINKNYDFKK